MNKWLSLFIYLLVFLLHSISSFDCSLPILQKALQESNNNNVSYLIIGLVNFIINISDAKVFLDRSFNICCEELIIAATEHTDKFQDTLNYCGKDLCEQGQETECFKNNQTTFFLFKYKLDLKAFIENASYNTDYKVMNFLNVTEIYTGICMYRKCIDFLSNHYFNQATNKKLMNYLKTQAHISNLEFQYSIKDDELNHKDKNVKDWEINNLLGLITSMTITIGSLCLFIIMIITAVWRMFYIILSEENQDITITQRNSVLTHNDEKNNDSYENIDQIMFDNNTNTDYQKKNKCVDYEQIYHFLGKIDIVTKIGYLFGLKNKHYNDEGLEVVAFIRLITMFFLVYYHVCYSLLIIPPHDPYNITFYQSAMFPFVKLSTFAMICWIILDGVTIAYKLMSYIKHDIIKTNSKISFKLFVKFFVYSISKVFVVMFLFLYIHILGGFFRVQFSMGILFDYVTNKIKPYHCNSIDCIFIPFPTNTTMIEENSPFKTSTFYNIYQNEFYSMILILFILYLSFKLRSKFFDSSILFILFMNSLFTFFYYPFYNRVLTTSSFQFILGQNYSYQFPYLFINYYFMGFFVGICYFYYNDMLSSLPLSQIDDQLPFAICFWIVTKCDQMKYLTKRLFLWFSILLLLSIATTFSLFQYFNDGEIQYNLTIYHNLIDVYEKGLFGFIFCVILIVILVFPKDTSLKHLILSNIFLLFDRIETVFFCICKFVIFIAITTLNYKIEMNFHEFFFTSLGLLILTSLGSILGTIMYEIPIRILIKMIMIRNYEGIINNNEHDNNIKNNSKSRMSLFKDS